MKRTTNANGWHWLWRAIAGLLLIAYSTACTHLPSGEKAFDSFESCFATNLGLAAVGGVAVGVVSTHLAKQATGSATAGKNVGIAAGIATAAMIAMTAWRKCGAVYNKSEPIRPAAAPRPEPAPTVAPATTPTPAPTSSPAPAMAAPAAAARQKPRLNLDRLEVRVEGTENDPPVPEFEFSFSAENPAAKDIKAKFRHKVEIVRFKAGANDSLVLADDKGEAMLDNGKEIPLAAAIKMSREKLHWVAIAEEGKDDYVEDVVIQQGQRTGYRHKLQVPPRADLPLPLPVPMRYTLTIEAEQMKSARVVDFAILGSGERPKRYGSRIYTPPANAPEQPGSPSAPASASSQPVITNRKTPLFSDTTPTRKTLVTLKKGALVRIEERAQATLNHKTAEWAKVTTEDGATGWLPASHLTGSK